MRSQVSEHAPHLPVNDHPALTTNNRAIKLAVLINLSEESQAESQLSLRTLIVLLESSTHYHRF